MGVLRATKVRQFTGFLCSQQNVRGFNVEMKDATIVNVAEGCNQLVRVDFPIVLYFFVNQGLEGSRFRNQLHNDQFFRFTDGCKDVDDIGMKQGG